MNTNFINKIDEVIARDARYKADAYEFVMQALFFTQKKLKRKDHVSGKEMLEGIKEHALSQYGPMAKTVVEHWGIYTTSDFGQIVFNMIEAGLMKKTQDDSLEDFKDVYDFKNAFNVFKIKPQRAKRKALIKSESKNLLP